MIFLNRTACLGGDVTQYKVGTNHYFNNQQKVRADMFVDIINGNNKPKSDIILQLLNEPHSFGGIYKQSEQLLWLNMNDKPDFLFIDNYCELTDKKFIHKDGWSFCGAYGDFKTECFTDGTLTDHGLLDINLLEYYYDKMFEFIKNKWNVPIIFMHFPTSFETREKYINQGKAIINAMNKLAIKYNIQNIMADDCEIELTNNYTYHFTNKTIKNMSNKIII